MINELPMKVTQFLRMLNVLIGLSFKEMFVPSLMLIQNILEINKIHNLEKHFIQIFLL